VIVYQRAGPPPALLLYRADRRIGVDQTGIGHSGVDHSFVRDMKISTYGFVTMALFRRLVRPPMGAGANAADFRLVESMPAT